MEYTVEIKRSAEKELDALPSRVANRILARLVALGGDPRPVGSKKLSGEDRFRIRVGDYRVLYEIDEAVRMVIVVAVGHRREVYR